MDLFIGELMDVPNLTYFRLLSGKTKHTVVVSLPCNLFFSYLNNKIMSLLLWPSKHTCVFRSTYIYIYTHTHTYIYTHLYIYKNKFKKQQILSTVATISAMCII